MRLRDRRDSRCGAHDSSVLTGVLALFMLARYSLEFLDLLVRAVLEIRARKPPGCTMCW